MKRIETTDELRALLGDAHPLARNKIYDHAFADAAAFIARTPSAPVARSDGCGH